MKHNISDLSDVIVSVCVSKTYSTCCVCSCSWVSELRREREKEKRKILGQLIFLPPSFSLPPFLAFSFTLSVFLPSLS